MKSNGILFHHPVAFWIGCLLIVAGVLCHFPMFIMSSHMGYQMAGMPMDSTMLTGMFMIPTGLIMAIYGLMPRLDQLRGNLQHETIHFHIQEGTVLNLEHWKLAVVLIVALAVDVMKPATLGFVMPGMVKEYEITRQTAGYLALFALTGTMVGSLIWGRFADSFGRRAAILLSALMFIATAICGAMPTFNWNLGMCFLMGAAAGGLLPITFTLMAEMIPAAHRGWLLVGLGGLGTAAGYFLAAGSATLLEPLFSWRILWLLGLPTGAIIILLNRFIPESPRFLVNMGLNAEARAVMAKYSAVIIEDITAMKAGSPKELAPQSGKLKQFALGTYAPLTCGLCMAGIAWGLVNFGFLLWLPSNLRDMGMNGGAASGLLARSAVIALPGIALVIWLYHRWSSIKALVLFIGLTALSILLFFVMSVTHIRSTPAIVVATASLLISASGVIAMLIPYSAEIYPIHLRGTGSGIIAASSKFGGILGALGGVLGLFNNMGASAAFIAIPLVISAMMLLNCGVDTRGRCLEDIHDDIVRRQST